MTDMFTPLIEKLKKEPRTIVFTEGNDPRILEAASRLLKDGILNVIMVGNTEEVKKAADFITGSNDEDGLVTVIDKFILDSDGQ